MVVSSSSSSSWVVVALVACGGDACCNPEWLLVLMVLDVDLDTGLDTIAEDTDSDKDDGAADIIMLTMSRVLILEVGNRKVIPSSS